MAVGKQLRGWLKSEVTGLFGETWKGFFAGLGAGS